MKKYFALILAAFALTTAVHAQTSSPQQTFFQSVGQYFTTFNTNLAWTNFSDNLNIWAGTDNVDNERMAASLGIAWNVLDKFSLEGVARNATVAGTLMSVQGGVGYSIKYVDVKVTGYLHAGKRLDDQYFYMAPGIRVIKKLTPNTHAGVSLELPIRFNHSTGQVAPTLGVFAAFSL